MPGNFVGAQGRTEGAATFGRLEGCMATSHLYRVNERRNRLPDLSTICARKVRSGCCSSRCRRPSKRARQHYGQQKRRPVLCEDGSGEEFVHGLTVTGDFPFAKNTVVLNGERNGLTVVYWL